MGAALVGASNKVSKSERAILPMTRAIFLRPVLPSQIDDNGLTTGLFLCNNNLRGYIPPETQHLSRLQYFHVDNNNFVVGTVPKEMERLTHLKGLWADGTNVTGSIDFLCYNFSNATIAECDNCGLNWELCSAGVAQNENECKE